jgi:hypothetical protein
MGQPSEQFITAELTLIITPIILVMVMFPIGTVTDYLLTIALYLQGIIII